ncbi:unnamed protein product [Moneuplotes crassus]|uniref:Uncharacterized protein n=1 Tax=Euplotes crassus TaxID=5936 RepID=A0AAD1U6L9_EUPCR|nr:unnamed protein product [Moneuplotes crassus]
MNRENLSKLPGSNNALVDECTNRIRKQRKDSIENVDLQSVLSYSSRISNGYYEGRKANYRNPKPFRNQKIADDEGTCRSMASEYDYKNPRALKRKAPSTSHSSRRRRLIVGFKQEKCETIKSQEEFSNKEDNQATKIKTRKYVKDEEQEDKEDYQNKITKDQSSENSQDDEKDELDKVDTKSLESVDTPRHQSDKESELQKDKVKLKKVHETIKLKAKAILEKIKNTPKKKMIFYPQQKLSSCSRVSADKQKQTQFKRPKNTKFENLQTYDTPQKTYTDTVPQNPSIQPPYPPNSHSRTSHNKLHSTCMYRTQALPILITDSDFKPRKWKMGLRDKLDTKKKYQTNSQKRQEKIDRTIFKQAVKQRIGIRLNYQNQKILAQMRASKKRNRGHGRTCSVENGVQEDNKGFPKSTIQHNFDSSVFRNFRVDKFTFKKLSSFGAYCNAQNSNGVFINPPATGI